MGIDNSKRCSALEWNLVGNSLLSNIGREVNLINVDLDCLVDWFHRIVTPSKCILFFIFTR